MTTAPTPPEAESLAVHLDQRAALAIPPVVDSLSKAAASMLRRLHAENERLRGQLGRFQGVPLPLIEAINAATGSNDWQGDHSPAELLEPACQAIAGLEARKPLPLSDEQIDDLHGEANRGFDIGREEYFKAFRDAERAHGITGGSS